MTKKELLEYLDPFTDDISIRVKIKSTKDISVTEDLNGFEYGSDDEGYGQVTLIGSKKGV